jgi:hypothetical protein
MPLDFHAYPEDGKSPISTLSQAIGCEKIETWFKVR